MKKPYRLFCRIFFFLFRIKLAGAPSWPSVAYSRRPIVGDDDDEDGDGDDVSCHSSVAGGSVSIAGLGEGAADDEGKKKEKEGRKDGKKEGKRKGK